MTKQEKIATLTANAEWKGAEKQLEAFSDPQLDHLLKLNAMPAALQKAQDEKAAAEKGAPVEEEEELDEEEEVVPVKNKRTPIASRLTEDELEVLNVAREIHDREKAALITRLVANVSEDKRAEHRKKLGAYKVPALRDLVALMPRPVQQTQNRAVVDDLLGAYSGLGLETQQVTNRRNEYDPTKDLLELPTTNWAVEPVKK